MEIVFVARCRIWHDGRQLGVAYSVPKFLAVPHQRFNRWPKNGAIERLFEALQKERIVAVEVRVLAMDSTSVKVHQHVAGAPEKGPQCIGVSRGGRNTKVHVVSDGEPTLVEVHLSPGNEHDVVHGRRLMAALGAFMGAHLLMDCAWEGDPTRLPAESFRLIPVVPPRRTARTHETATRRRTKGRNIVECVFTRMKYYRKASTQYDRLYATFLANLRLILTAIHPKTPPE